MSSEIMESRSQVKWWEKIFQHDILFIQVLVPLFQLPFSIMSRELKEGYEDDFETDDEVDIEYCVYDVTPDVSIDFVSFTTEESEGKTENWKSF